MRRSRCSMPCALCPDARHRRRRYNDPAPHGQSRPPHPHLRRRRPRLASKPSSTTSKRGPTSTSSRSRSTTTSKSPSQPAKPGRAATTASTSCPASRSRPSRATSSPSIVEEPIPSLRPVEETIEAVHRQGGVCFVPHPMSWLTRSIGPGTMARVAAQRRPQVRRHRAGQRQPARARRSGQSPPPQRRALPPARRRRLRRPLRPGDRQPATPRFEGTTAADLRAPSPPAPSRGAQTPYPSLREVGLLRTVSLPSWPQTPAPRLARTAWSVRCGSRKVKVKRSTGAFVPARLPLRSGAGS